MARRRGDHRQVVGGTIQQEDFMKEKTTKTLVDRAHQMRKVPTEEENKMWYILLRKIRPRFIRQRIIGNYIVDFCCNKLKLVIEIDGEQHYLPEYQVYEKRRTEYLENCGYKILRFYNSDINKKLSDTETMIYYSCIDRAKTLGIDVTVRLKERG